MPQNADSSITGSRILVADDSPGNISVLVGALESAGHEVLAASRGLDALRIAEKARPDLILLDVMMPELDGIETCRRLKQSAVASRIPVIFITGQDNPGRLVEAFQAGGVDYVVKPFQMEEVLSRVGTHLRLSRVTQELEQKNRALEERTRELLAEANRRRDAEAAFRRVDETLTRLSDLESERWNISGLIGRSEPMRVLVEHIRRLQQFPALSPEQLETLVGKMKNEGVLYHGLQTLGGGSILGGLVLGAIGVFVIDRKFRAAAGFAAAGAVMTFFGFMHGERIGIGQSPIVALSYGVVAGMFLAAFKFAVVAPKPAEEPAGHGVESVPA